MAKRSHIGQRKLLPWDIYVADKGTVYNQTFSNANKYISITAKLGLHYLFNLPQLEGKHADLFVGLHKSRIITIGCNIDNPVRCNAHQINRRRYQQLFLH